MRRARLNKDAMFCGLLGASLANQKAKILLGFIMRLVEEIMG